MSTSHWYLVSYDVRDAKRLRKTAKILEGYGERIQFSVFRVYLTVDRIKKLNWELSSVLEEVDELLIIPLCNQCASKVESRSEGKENWGDPPPSFELL
jgi:CRISPR-associated protein Cas2